jgi:hypothetical protein
VGAAYVWLGVLAGKFACGWAAPRDDAVGYAD